MPDNRTRITNLDIKVTNIPDDYVLTVSGGEAVWLPPTASGTSGGVDFNHPKLLWIGV